jgi:esterase/lipase superfamily enzyme
LLLTLAACGGSKKFYELDLMPAPDIYGQANIDPFNDIGNLQKAPYNGILYATDREPAGKEGETYLNARGHLLRLGVGNIDIGTEDITWDEAREVSLLKNRTDKYPLKVTGVEEIGILERSLSSFTDPEMVPEDPGLGGRKFAELVNRKLSISKRKDIFIYVHGYKVVFDNPLLVATELWHFLGYDGAFIAYAWPSTPKTLAYGSDLETAALSSHNLRNLLSYLAETTDAEQIHIVGYSAGTRVVIGALNQLCLSNPGATKAELQQKLRLGHVILVGSDFDRQLFGAYIETSGLLNVSRTLTVLMSEEDKALNFSRRVFRRDRLGQMWPDRKLPPLVVDFLNQNPDLRFIDVTGAQEATSGNGHAYFRKSPWVSSDVLMTLLYDLAPSDRGLVQAPDLPVWTFPPDYIERLRNSLAEHLPGFQP